ncbi:hypothetical protein RM572_04125 [Streptomyces sp. DSM 42041]|uniref:Uncharacterized protein n=1 Tax=Streptomyces hazeniae TaxID=3075538 RepID=A0ABU2NMZ1_9ACTN|nr:hypothetical protein [Streptomyces sp. DSM 42041]MDT0377961.1 hypothetical protein [Streptomyces sp. DSM 42041]
MTLQDDMTSVQRCLDDLTRCVTRLEQQVGSGLEMRRVRSDAEHLRESLALLRAATGGTEASPAPRPEMVTIPDAPYDAALWTDAEDEGLGARDRHAP